jgi:hypothetical protein
MAERLTMDRWDPRRLVPDQLPEEFLKQAELALRLPRVSERGLEMGLAPGLGLERVLAQVLVPEQALESAPVQVRALARVQAQVAGLAQVPGLEPGAVLELEQARAPARQLHHRVGWLESLQRLHRKDHKSNS